MRDAVIVVAPITAKPGREADVERAIRACLAPSRGDAGCLLYTAHRDASAPGHYCFVEHWASQADLDAHMQTAHFAALAAALKDSLSTPLAALPLESLD